MVYTPPRGTEHQYRYWITEHAVGRFRERAGDGLHGGSDQNLARLLDARLFNGFASGRVAAVIDADHPEKETRIVEIEAQDGTKAVVVMRPHKPDAYPRLTCVGDPGRAALAAITVLTPEMAAANYSTGRWKVPMQRPFAEKLKDLPVAPKPISQRVTPAPTGAQRPVAISAAPKNEHLAEVPSLVAPGQPHKLCARCKVDKVLTEFSKCSNSGDGLQSWCKVCQRVAARNDRKEIAEARAAGIPEADKPSMSTVERYEIVRRYFRDDPSRSVKGVIILMAREHGCTVGKEAARAIREAVLAEMADAPEPAQSDRKTIAVEAQPAQATKAPEPVAQEAMLASELVSAITEERQAKLAMDALAAQYKNAKERVASLMERLNASRA